MTPTIEEVKRVAEACGGRFVLGLCRIEPRELQAFAQHYIEIGRKMSQKSYTDIMTKPQIMFDEVCKPVAVAIRNNTGE